MILYDPSDLDADAWWDEVEMEWWESLFKWMRWIR